jgi:hypothetical protein
VKFSLSKHEPQFRDCLFLFILYSIPVMIMLRSTGVSDADVWWHLRTGEWIVQHHWVLHNDWFSNSGMGKSWAAYSWLFEVLIYGLVSRLGLAGLLVYVGTLTLAITAALHSLVRKFQLRLAYSVALTILTLLALASLFTPRPWLFTILFFIIELNVLVSVRRSRNYRALLVLLPLFALWANLHIQFIYGLFVLGVAALEEPINRLLRREPAPEDDLDRPLRFRTMILVIVACLAATLVNPYHFRIYAIVLDTLRMAELYGLIGELQAMQFRSIPDWIVLLLTLAAAFAVGRRRTINPFWGLLLLAGAFLSFRSGRDLWFVCIIAAAIVSSSFSAGAAEIPTRISKGQVLVVILMVGAVIALTVRAKNLTNPELQKVIARDYPVDAAHFVEEYAFPGPLYNHFDWGGYLIWRLPGLPVSIDGRGNVHDPTHIRHSAEVWSGKQNWASDAELAAARLVIAKKDFPLTQLLRLDSRFEIVYEDGVAVVFVARRKSEPPA